VHTRVGLSTQDASRLPFWGWAEKHAVIINITSLTEICDHVFSHFFTTDLEEMVDRPGVESLEREPVGDWRYDAIGLLD
jgi:hypothetical protein